MGRRARTVTRASVTVRFEPDEMAAIDHARGDITRQAWIHGLALGGPRLNAVVPVAISEAKEPPKAQAMHGPSFGPRKTIPGDRLKRK